MKLQLRLFTLLLSASYGLIPISVNLITVDAAMAQFKLPTPPKRGAAGKRVGGASRGKVEEVNRGNETSNEDCPVIATPLTVLVPEYQKSDGSKQVWGLTSSSKPMLWFYQPYQQDTVGSIEVALFDAKLTNKAIYRTSIPAAQKPGIQGIFLTNTSLANNKDYRWVLNLKLKCRDDLTISAQGWVQRVKLDEPASLAVFNKKGLWYDAISTVVQSRQSNSSDPKVVQDWMDLLKVIRLESLASKPIVR
jgi:hypothetical protein